MVIKASAGAEVRRLVDRLGRESEVAREAAVARLTVIGGRAVQALIGTAGDGHAAPRARAAAFRALEAIGDARAFAPALRAVGDRGADPAVLVAALGVLRARLAATAGEGSGQAFEPVAAIALDVNQDDAARVAAVAALEAMGKDVAASIRDRLGGEPGGAGRGVMAGRPVRGRAGAGSIADALDRGLESPTVVRARLAAQAASAPLPTLYRLVGAIRAKEAAAPEGERADWLVARAAVHQALAARHSTVALYDLRETLDAARGPLPVGFLAALHSVGDASCLEPLAGAYVRSTGSREDWWQSHLAVTFRDIVHRRRLTRRHAAVRRVAARWPGVLDTLLPPGRPG